VRLLIALAVLLFAPAGVQAALLRPYEERVHVDTECPDGGGTCAQTPDIYLAPGANQFMLWHERGHLFDAQVLTDADRAWYTKRLRMEGPWFQGTGPGTRGPSEVFADAYAACALNRQPRRETRGEFRVVSWELSYGYQPGLRQHRRICNAIALQSWVSSIGDR
jgi:hypothetical protein